MNPLLLENAVAHDAEVRPYIRLWAEVMRQGVQDFCNARARGASENNPHILWFWSENKDVGSFIWMCDLFGLHIGNARTQVMKNWRAHVDKRQAFNTREKRSGR